MTIKTKTSPVWHPFTQAKTAPPPLKVRSGHGVTLELEDGRKIIDCISSWWVNIHGHSQPEIAKAIYDQAQTLEHVMFAGFSHEPAENLANNVLKYLPNSLNKVFFSDDGSTAVEVALKMAYQYWLNRGVKGRTKFIGFEQGYHGDTIGAMSIGATSPFWQTFEPLLFQIDFVPFPDTWDRKEGILEQEKITLAKLSQLVEQSNNQYAGIVLEPLMQGAGGMRMCRPEFLQALEKFAKENDLLVIYDEVMTGFGRTGDWFACRKSKTVPDILCLSKGLTGGFLPLALTIATEDIYQTFYSDDLQKAFFHGHSYTGNPIACAAANASYKLLEQNSKKFTAMENLHRKFLERWLVDNQFLEKFRVCGTIAAFDVVTKDESNYFNAVSLPMRHKFLELGFLIRPLGNTIYLMPPYCISEDELESAYEAISRVVTEVITP